MKDRQGIASCSETEGLLFEKRVFALGREKALNEGSQVLGIGVRVTIAEVGERVGLVEFMNKL